MKLLSRAFWVDPCTALKPVDPSADVPMDTDHGEYRDFSAGQDRPAREPETASIGRRDFVRALGFGPVAAADAALAAAQEKGLSPAERRARADTKWPSLRYYDQNHLARIALPLGGIGTGTVSLGGRGDLRDWEIMNRPAKGFVPAAGDVRPFFALFAREAGKPSVCRILEGPLEAVEYEGSHGSPAPKHNLPRFRNCSFAAAYPFGRVMLADDDVPLEVDIKGFNPLVPPDADRSGIPVAILRFELANRTPSRVTASVCATLPNFVGIDGWEERRDWKGDTVFAGASRNRNEFREGRGVRGLFMSSQGVARDAAQWGTMALATTSPTGVTHREFWAREEWGKPLLDFWDDFSADGGLDYREAWETDTPLGSLAVAVEVPPQETREVIFLLGWHFPNRYTWTPRKDVPAAENILGNYYATKYADAWDVLEKTAPSLASLESETVDFLRAFCGSSLPLEVKEAALFNLSTLRTQTCFRTPDGRFFGWEGMGNRAGCCHGSCTHVWNYEQATPFLFGGLAMTMREVEFDFATGEDGQMSFRVHLPLSRGREFGKSAADGQMGCIMKMYRDWQLSGDDATLRRLWPKVRKSLEFCWIPGGWDADRDGVMEGCQHNTMDVEYYGPNPQMGTWYLGALRAAEEMSRYLGDEAFATLCSDLFDRGSRWLDRQLFNGEYYEQRVQPPKDKSEIAPSLLVGMGARDISKPDYQLGRGCLVDQLVGQLMAHVCGLGYLLDKEHVRKTLRSVLKYNLREDMHGHFNCLRTFATGPESALLMAAYPGERPANPFPYFTEVMTGFEYTAAAGMLYEGMIEEGIKCIGFIRQRYDGSRRSPFDEAECGHHYVRAMASWAAALAITGFQYSAPTGTMTFNPTPGAHFWSTGRAWGECRLRRNGDRFEADLHVRAGRAVIRRLMLRDFGEAVVEDQAASGRRFQVTIVRR